MKTGFLVTGLNGNSPTSCGKDIGARIALKHARHMLIMQFLGNRIHFFNLFSGCLRKFWNASNYLSSIVVIFVLRKWRYVSENIASVLQRTKHWSAIIIIMHQSFVTTAHLPVPTGNSGENYSFLSPVITLTLWRQTDGYSPALCPPSPWGLSPSKHTWNIFQTT